MSKSDFRPTLAGYSEIIKEIEVCRKYGRDYTLDRGKTERLVSRLHPKRLELVVNRIVDESPIDKSFYLTARKGILPPFQAGQYINLFVNASGIRTSRPYSICSSPRQKSYYKITVRRVENGLVSNYLLDNVQVGDELTSTGPLGHFYYNPLFHGERLLMVAGGSGVTPFRSMIKEVYESGLARKISLVHGAGNMNELVFHSEFRELAGAYESFDYYPVVERPVPGYRGLQGRIPLSLLREIYKGQRIDTIYLSGPGAMVEFFQKELIAEGIPLRRIRSEHYAGSLKDVMGWPGKVRLGEELAVEVDGRGLIRGQVGQSLQTILENNGMEPDAGCRSGECGFCRIQLLTGELYELPGARVRSSDREYGYVHACCVYPLENLRIRL